MSTPVPANDPQRQPLSLEQENIIRTATVLANAGEIAAGILSNISGNDISTAINGNKASTEMIQSLLYQRIAKRVLEAA